MTTTTALISTTSPTHLAGDDRLVFTVTEAGDLLGISRAFATAYSPLLPRRPTPNAVPRLAAVCSTVSTALPRSWIRSSKSTGIA